MHSRSGTIVLLSREKMLNTHKFETLCPSSSNQLSPTVKSLLLLSSFESFQLYSGRKIKGNWDLKSKVKQYVVYNCHLFRSKQCSGTLISSEQLIYELWKRWWFEFCFFISIILLLFEFRVCISSPKRHSLPLFPDSTCIWVTALTCVPMSSYACAQNCARFVSCVRSS